MIGYGTQRIAIRNRPQLSRNLIVVANKVIEQVFHQVFRFANLLHYWLCGIHILEKKFAQLHHGIPYRLAHLDIVHMNGSLNHVVYQSLDTRRMIFAKHSMGRSGQIGLPQRTSANSVIDIVVHICNTVGRGNDAAFQRLCTLNSGMAHNAITHLGSKIEPLAIVFNDVDHTQTLNIVAIERLPFGRIGVDVLMARKTCCQRLFPHVAKGRMAQIMTKRYCLSKVFVQPQRTSNGARNLCNLKRMRETGTVMVAHRS